MLVTVNPNKLKKIRGKKTRREIVEMSGGKISEMNLSHWESGNWQPSVDKLKVLLKVLNCGVEDIAEPLKLELD